MRCVRGTQFKEAERRPKTQIPTWKVLGWLIRRNERIEDKLNRLLENTARFEWADKERDEKMSAETQAAIDELKAEVAPLTDDVTALIAAFDGVVAMLEEAGDDPVEIRAVAASVKTERDRIIAAALKGTGTPVPPPPPPPEPEPA